MRSDMTELRKQLRARGAEVYDEFAKYSERFCRLLGLRSEKALDLFNQIVSIKDIGGLNAFVRDHMLEKTDAQKRITELRENFENLTRAHAAIELAERQLAVLEPLMNESGEYEKLQTRIAEAEQCAQVVPVYIAARKNTLLESAITDAHRQQADAQGQRDALNQRLEHLEQQKIDLNVAIQNDRLGQRIQQIEQDMLALGRQRETKQQQAQQYNALARTTGLPEYSDEATFLANARQATALLAQSAQRITMLTTQRDEQKQRETSLMTALRGLAEELVSLQQRKSQIPGEDIRLRSMLAAGPRHPGARTTLHRRTAARARQRAAMGAGHRAPAAQLRAADARAGTALPADQPLRGRNEPARATDLPPHSRAAHAAQHFRAR